LDLRLGERRNNGENASDQKVLEMVGGPSLDGACCFRWNDRIRRTKDETLSSQYRKKSRSSRYFAEGDKMSAKLTLSIFTIEVDRNPVLAIQGRKHSEIEHLIADADIRSQLSLLKSAGKPLCDDYSIFRIRIARPAERQLYYDNTASLLTSDGQLAVLLAVLDDPS
jgi:hypothetical protein